MVELNKIYNEDFLLNSLPDNCVDLVVTDPPYKCISGGHEKGLSYKHIGSITQKNDGKIFEHNDILPSSWIPEVYRVLKPDSHCYIMVNTLNLELFLQISRESGFKLHNVLVWEKQNCLPNRWYMKNCEYILFLRKGKAKPINYMGSKTVHQFVNPQGNKLHPTEKPIDLMELYIANSSIEQGIVLDPFMGSGTTAIACINTNRNFIGFELDTTYCGIANKRIQDALSKKQ